MTNLTRTNQGGSVVSFLVVGIILVGLVIGGIYAVQKRGGNAPTTPVVTTSPAASTSATPSPAPSKTASPSAQPSQPPAPTQGGAKTSPLPATGPSDNLPAAVAFAILLGIVISYVQSRRVRYQSARK